MSPTNTTERVLRLNKKLVQDFQEVDYLYHCVGCHIQRPTDTNTLLAQQLEICEGDVKKSLDHRAIAKASINCRTILEADPIVLRSANTNCKIVSRKVRNSEKLVRLQA